ncbi:carboxypeptidase-like regulatory domain-containing protein, partial [uncultured Duncaniella sp.]
MAALTVPGVFAAGSGTSVGQFIPPIPVDNKQVSLIRGVVTDVNGDPLPGASVWEKKNLRAATATDVYGIFTLPAKGRTSVKLEISYIGMKKAEVTWHGDMLAVMLEDDANVLQDVVVTGYQVIDKRASTSA